MRVKNIICFLDKIAGIPDAEFFSKPITDDGSAFHVDKTNACALPDDLKHYLNPNDFNRVIYLQGSTDVDESINQLLADADRLPALCESDYNGSTEYVCLPDVCQNRPLSKMKNAGCIQKKMAA